MLTQRRIKQLKAMAWEAREARFIELGKQGANADVRHQCRNEWEMIRDLLQREGRLLVCDCQNPEPASGVALVSMSCPVHNLHPKGA